MPGSPRKEEERASLQDWQLTHESGSTTCSAPMGLLRTGRDRRWDGHGLGGSPSSLLKEAPTMLLLTQLLFCTAVLVGIAQSNHPEP